MENASKGKEEAKAEIAKNLEILNDAQENYIDIKNEIINITNSFNNDLQTALESIKETEAKIKDNLEIAEKAEQVLQETLK